jgi:hypothetical protein
LESATGAAVDWSAVVWTVEVVLVVAMHPPTGRCSRERQ